MDVTKEKTIEEAARFITSITPEKRPLRLLINSAGYLLPEKSLKSVEEEQILKHLRVNTIGPLLVAKHFSPLFGNVDQNASVFKNPVLTNMSARTGSIGDNKLGGWHSYRLSKAALNQVTRTLATEFGRKGLICVSLHPGTVVSLFDLFAICNLTR